MRSAVVFALAAVTAVVLTGCGLFGGGNDSSKSADLYQGNISVGLADSIAPNNTYVLQNIYHPNTRQILAIVQIENAKPGMKVSGQWYQMGVIQTKAKDLTPVGALISEAGFTLDANSVKDGVGSGTLRLVPNAPLPEDSYELRVYVDGKLAKTAPFVVSKLVNDPTKNTQSNTPDSSPPASPARTATPAR
jgi:hypothetical protein